MAYMNFRTIKDRAIDISNFDCDISSMINGLYIGPQGDLLEAIDSFNTSYNTDLQVTKQFTLKPGGYDKIKNAYSDWVLRWDMKPRGIESIFNRIRDFDWRKSQFKNSILDIDRRMTSLRSVGSRWQDNTEDFIAELTKAKDNIINSLDVCRELYPNLTINAMLMPTTRVRRQLRRRFNGGRECFPGLPHIATPDEYILILCMYIKNPEMTVHILNADETIDHYVIPMDDIVIATGTYLLPLISRNWRRNGARLDRASARESLFLECLYLSNMKRGEHPYMGQSTDKYAWDLDASDHTVGNICLGNMLSELKDTLLNMQIEAHITQIMIWLTNYYVPQTNPLNNVRKLRNFGQNKLFMGWSEEHSAFNIDMVSSDCNLPTSIHSRLKSFATKQYHPYHYGSDAITIGSTEYIDRKQMYLENFDTKDLPCNECNLKDDCHMFVNISLLFQRKQYTPMEEGYIGYFMEIANYHSRDERIPDFVEEVIQFADYHSPEGWNDRLLMADGCAKKWALANGEGLGTTHWLSSRYRRRLLALMAKRDHELEALYKIALDDDNDVFIWTMDEVSHFRVSKVENKPIPMSEDEAVQDFLRADLEPLEIDPSLSPEERALQWATAQGGATNL